jgi:hypothetical protein
MDIFFGILDIYPAATTHETTIWLLLLLLLLVVFICLFLKK